MSSSVSVCVVVVFVVAKAVVVVFAVIVVCCNRLLGKVEAPAVAVDKEVEDVELEAIVEEAVVEESGWKTGPPSTGWKTGPPSTGANMCGTRKRATQHGEASFVTGSLLVLPFF